MKTIIVYGSTTGNNATIADIIHKALASEGMDATINNVAHVEPEVLKDFNLVIIGSSTWGDGELQDDMMVFHEKMASLNLEGKRFAAFGVGEDSWPNFCSAPDILFDRMKECGAESVVEVLKVNGDANSSQDLIISWAKSLVKAI